MTAWDNVETPVAEGRRGNGHEPVESRIVNPHSSPAIEDDVSTENEVRDAPSLPYWQMNLPPDRRPEKCPDFLLNVSNKDRGILSTKDEDYQWISWTEVKDIIAKNDLASFRRLPTDLRRYLEFTTYLKHEYGSILNFVQKERLCWTSLAPSGDPPFSNPSDYKILWNDWPYGIDPNITHLVVWTKFAFEVDPINDDVTPKVRAEIEKFVCQKFCRAGDSGLDRSMVIWFKNWSGLKSVEAIEHFHVMLYKADKTFVDRITHGDRPLVEYLSDTGSSA